MSGDDGNNKQESGQQRQTDQSDSGGENQSNSNSESEGDNSEKQQQRASQVEKGIVVISVILTLLLFSYAGWQIVASPRGGVPQASVIGTESLDDGSVAVTVQLRNPSDIGLVSVTVESDCSSPPTELQFTFVPASSTRTGTLVCPPGTTDPSVSLTNWVRR